MSLSLLLLVVARQDVGLTMGGVAPSGTKPTVAVASELGVRDAKRLAAFADETSLRREADRLGWRIVSQNSVRVAIDPEAEGASALNATAALDAFDAESGYAPLLASDLPDRKFQALSQAATPWADPQETPSRDYAFVLRASVSGTLSLNGKTATFRMILPDLAENPPLPVRKAALPRVASASKSPLPVGDSITCVFSSTIPAEDRPDAAARAMVAVKERRTAALRRLDEAKRTALETFLRRSGALGSWDARSPVALGSLSPEARDSILVSMRLPGGVTVDPWTMEAWKGARIIDAKPILSIGTRTQDANGRVSDFLTNLGGSRWSSQGAPRP